jgi:23S rRNA (uracil1939-C5)-methyltransferase
MEVTIEKLIYGGEGLAHHEGAAMFVPFVLPGESVSVTPVEQKKKFVRAQLEKVLAPSGERVTAQCRYFGTCGGCDYQHIPYGTQLRYKTEILRETLRRLGRIDWPGEITAHPSPPWGYRNRAQWKVRPIRKGGNDQESEGSGTSSAERKLDVGYFRASSTLLCPVDTCEIISPLLLKTFRALCGMIAADAFPKTLREIEAFANAKDSKLLLTFTFAGFPAKADELTKKIRESVPELESLLFFDPTRERMELFGPGFIEYETGAAAFRVGHFSFFQVNRFLIDDLVRVAADYGGTGRLAIDLFAGVGLFSAALTKRFERVVAVESNPAAARDLEGNIHGAMIEVRASDVDAYLARSKEKPNLVLLDPPRAGMEPDAIKQLLRLAPERITYVSCEPPTLARDLAGLREGGYDISEVHLFDLFPQTFHMEAVVRLKRRQ